MITPYYGEFMTSPYPLEMSLNWCTHGCKFCFANLNTPDRTANVKAITNLIRDHQTRETLVAQLMQHRYPILISNKVDPFAASNYKISIPIMRTLSEMGFPIAIQTRGGRGVDEVLGWLPKSHWYISIGHLNEEVRKRVEPGAPTIADRLSLIDQLVDLGHVVTVGANPLVPEWCPRPSELFLEVKRRGAVGVWIEMLHLNNNQTRAMSDRDKQAIGTDVIAKAMIKNTPADWHNYFVDSTDEAKSCGLEVYCINNPNPSGYWTEPMSIYPVRFPVMQEFVNWCHAKLNRGDLVWFEHMWRHIGDGLPEFRKSISDYIGATTPQIKNSITIPKDAGFKTLLSILWSQSKAKQYPAKLWCFDEAFEIVDSERSYIDDENGFPVFQFTGRGVQRKVVK